MIFDQIAQFRSDNLDRNLRIKPDHHLRCEMCWKPLTSPTTIRWVKALDDGGFTLPKTSEEVVEGTADWEVTEVALGADCHRKLLSHAHEHGFLVVVCPAPTED